MIFSYKKDETYMMINLEKLAWVRYTGSEPLHLEGFSAECHISYDGSTSKIMPPEEIERFMEAWGKFNDGKIIGDNPFQENIKIDPGVKKIIKDITSTKKKPGSKKKTKGKKS